MSDSLKAIEEQIKTLEEGLDAFLNFDKLMAAQNLTASFNDRGLALVLNVNLKRILLEIQRQGELTRAALKK